MGSLSAVTYMVDVKPNVKRTNHKAFIRFRGLLHELGLSGYAEEVLAVKVEVDTNPPAQAGLMTTPLTKHVPLNLQHHDPPTLLADKLSTVLQRDYLKGRDIYDLWWYLSQASWPEPNLVYLNNCLQQGGWHDDPISSASWRIVVREKILPLNWSLVMEDVGSFIIDSRPEAEFSKDRMSALLAKKN